MGADDGVEVGVEAGQLERAQDEGERRVGDERDRRSPPPQLLEQLAGAEHRLDPVLELGDDQRVQLLDQLLGPARRLEPAFQDPRGDRRRAADQLALVGGGELEAAAGEHVGLGPGPDRLGVEQQAVVVEDDGGGQVRRHRRDHPKLGTVAPA